MKFKNENKHSIINKAITLKLYNMNYAYKGIYLVRLISFFLIFSVAMISLAYFTGGSILKGLSLATALIIFIIICEKIGRILR